MSNQPTPTNYKTIIKPLENPSQALLFGSAFENPPNELVLYKEHMYSLFLLLYFHGEREQKAELLGRIQACRAEYRGKQGEGQGGKGKQGKNRKSVLEMLDYVQGQLKKQPTRTDIHSLTDRESIRKAFKAIFHHSQKLTPKSAMNLTDFAKLAASLIDAHCDIYDYYDFQVIQFRHQRFQERDIDVFIQIDKERRVYRYVKQRRDWRLTGGKRGGEGEREREREEKRKGGEEEEKGETLMFKNFSIKMMESIHEGVAVEEGQEEEKGDEDDEEIAESVVAESISQSVHYQLPAGSKTNQNPNQKQSEPTFINSKQKANPNEQKNGPENAIANMTSSQMQHQHQEPQQLSIAASHQQQLQSEVSETTPIDISKLAFQPQPQKATPLQNEVKNILKSITLQDFLGGFDKNKLASMPAYFHSELARKVDRRLSVDFLDQAMEGMVEGGEEGDGQGMKESVGVRKIKESQIVEDKRTRQENILCAVLGILSNGKPIDPNPKQPQPSPQPIQTPTPQHNPSKKHNYLTQTSPLRQKLQQKQTPPRKYSYKIEATLMGLPEMPLPGGSSGRRQYLNERSQDGKGKGKEKGELRKSRFKYLV